MITFTLEMNCILLFSFLFRFFFVLTLDPDVVVTAALSRLRAYSNFALPTLEAIKHINSFSFDVLCCMDNSPPPLCRLYSRSDLLLCELADGGEKKADGVSNSEALINLALFTGQLLKKFSHKIDMYAAKDASEWLICMFLSL